MRKGRVLIEHLVVSYFQPQAQAYPLPDGSAFPATHGKTASFFQASGVQQEFAFIPDDGSNTFVINVETNTTQSLAGPPSKDPNAIYAASVTALVQLDSTGALSFLPYKEGDASTNSAAKWASVAAVAAVAPPGSSAAASPSSVASGSASGASPAPTKSGSSSGAGASGSNTGSPSQTAGGSQQTGGALSTSKGATGFAVIAAGALAFFGLLL